MERAISELALLHLFSTCASNIPLDLKEKEEDNEEEPEEDVEDVQEGFAENEALLWLLNLSLSTNVAVKWSLLKPSSFLFGLFSANFAQDSSVQADLLKRDLMYAREALSFRNKEDCLFCLSFWWPPISVFVQCSTGFSSKLNLHDSAGEKLKDS